MLRSYDILDAAGMKVAEQQHGDEFTPVLLSGQTAVITGEHEPEADEPDRPAPKPRAKPVAKAKPAAKPAPDPEPVVTVQPDPVPETE